MNCWRRTTWTVGSLRSSRGTRRSIPVLRNLADRLEIDFSKFAITLDRYGNTASASVLIAFDDLMMSGRVQAGDLVVLVVFGGGLDGEPR